jgi:O-antigen/teichoic acid export membrane protein
VSTTIRRRFPFLVNTGYATATAGSAVLLLALLTVAGRFLSAGDYGRFRYALALTTIIETVMDSGLTQVTTRTVARGRETASTLFEHVLGLKLVWIFAGLALLAVIAPVLRSDPQVVRLCYLMGLSSAVRSYLLTARGLLQGLDRFDLEAVAVVVDRVLLLLTGVAVLWAGYGLLGLALAFVASRLTMIAVVRLLLGRVVGPVQPRYDRDVWRDLQSAALPLGFFMLTLNMYTYIDTVILGIIRTDVETGWYAASYSVYEGITYAPAILSAVLTPRLSNLFVHDRTSHRRVLIRALIAAVALGTVLGVTTAWAARPLVVGLFGIAYAPAAAPLQVLASGSLFVFATWILHAAAISSNLDRRLLTTTVVGLGANIALNLLLVPPRGIQGAAWATVLAEALTVVLLFVQVWRRVNQP